MSLFWPVIVLTHIGCIRHDFCFGHSVAWGFYKRSIAEAGFWKGSSVGSVICDIIKWKLLSIRLFWETISFQLNQIVYWAWLNIKTQITLWCPFAIHMAHAITLCGPCVCVSSCLLYCSYLRSTWVTWHNLYRVWMLVKITIIVLNAFCLRRKRILLMVCFVVQMQIRNKRKQNQYNISVYTFLSVTVKVITNMEA